MKILFVCMQYIHSARWINQLKDSNHDIYVFDCLDKSIHQDLLWTNYITNWSKRKIKPVKGEYFLQKNYPSAYELIAPFLKVTASQKLEELIKEIQPDLVHSLEMQSETYPLLKVRRKVDFKWAYFSWGSDMYLYQDKSFHSKKIRSILKQIDYLFTDNSRDIKLAKKLGYSKKELPVFPGGGGYVINVEKVISSNERNLILIKGYHHWAGRALVVLNALELLIDKIQGYDIYVYSAHPIVIEKIDKLNSSYDLSIEYSSRYNEISHEELIAKFKGAKIAIGNSISDGIPNTLLEAIVYGTFPIQSNPGGVTEEYIENGKNGFLINNPEEISEVARLIEEALNDEALLQKAQELNKNISSKLSKEVVRQRVVRMYQQIEQEIS